MVRGEVAALWCAVGWCVVRGEVAAPWCAVVRGAWCAARWMRRGARWGGACGSAAIDQVGAGGPLLHPANQLNGTDWLGADGLFLPRPAKQLDGTDRHESHTEQAAKAGGVSRCYGRDHEFAGRDRAQRIPDQGQTATISTVSGI